MKRKRGRPPILSPEEKLKRQTERWRRNKAKRRQQHADNAWIFPLLLSAVSERGLTWAEVIDARAENDGAGGR
jgi:hypothetical protein